MITLMKILHTAVAAWFGHELLLPSDLWTSLGGEAAALLVRLRRAETLGIATGLGMLLTGALPILAIRALRNRGCPPNGQR